MMSAAAAFWYVSKGSFTEPLLLVMWGHAALLAARNVPIFMIAAAPLVAGAMEEWLARLPELQGGGAAAERGAEIQPDSRGNGRTDDFPAGTWRAWRAPRWWPGCYAPPPPKCSARNSIRNRTRPRPSNAAQRSFGAHLHLRPMGRLPHLPPLSAHQGFVDGRSDFYGDEFEKKYVDILNVKYDWEKTFNGFGVDTILLPPSAPLAGALKESSRWRVVYDDGVALVFRPAQKTAGESNSAATGGGKRP